MVRSDGAEVLDHLAELRVIDIKADLIASGARAVDPAVRPDRQRTDFATQARHDFTALLQRVGGRIVHEHVHAPSAVPRRGDVEFAIRAERSAREIELEIVRQSLPVDLPCAEVHGVEPGRPPVLFEVHLKHIPTLAVHVRHHPTLPDVDAACRRAQRIDLQHRCSFEFLSQLWLLNSEPLLLATQCLRPDNRCIAAVDPHFFLCAGKSDTKRRGD